MVECAYVFPGQGAQYVGMGRDLYDNYDDAKEIFEQANKALGFDIAKLCFEGPLEELTKTENCQPAIVATSMAAFKVFRSENRKFDPKITLGLSLGEYSALVAAGVLEFSDAVKLVRSRGQFMEEAARNFPGKMASILGLPVKAVAEMCGEAGCEIANLNCPGQIVVSGTHDSIEKIVNISKEKGAKRAIVLQVSGPFHSSLMSQAGQRLKEEISKIRFSEAKIPMVSNVNASAETKPQEIIENLIDQVSCTTRWEDSVRYVASKGIKTFFEIGPGTVLKGLIKRIDATLVVHNIDNSEDIKTLLA